MKPEEKIIDSLLREHARNGTEADQAFLDDLEKRLDAEQADQATNPSSVVAPTSTPNSASKYGWGIAAVLTLGAVGFYFADRSEKLRETHLANNDSAAVRKQQRDASTAENALLSPGEVSPAEEKSAELSLTQPPAAPAKGKVLPPSPDPVPADNFNQRAEREVFDEENDGTALKDKAAPRERQKKKSPQVPAGKLIPQAERSEARHVRPSRPAPVAKSKSREPSLRGRGIRSDQKRLTPDFAKGNRYGALQDNQFISPWKKPLSTFSVDVDTASYTNLRSLISSRSTVPADAVRIEEMINYFNYAYPQPKGEHPFSVNVETASCPWNEKHRLVKIGLKGKDIIREKRPAANLVFLLDVSGSMNNRDKLPLLIDSMKILLKELNGDDTVSIVVYAGSKGLALPPTQVNQEGRTRILKKLENLHAGGSTNGGAGIQLAYKLARENFIKGGLNRVILGTDGDFNVGLTGKDALVSMVERQAKSGVFLSVLGMGQGNLNDHMLEAITNKGNGTYAYIDSLREGRKVFVDDMMGNLVPIAKDVKIQIEFNPAKVKSYRLIGYANRMLRAQDFRNKRIDAGDIGAGHTVTAFYEIVPGNAAEEAPVIDDLKYQKRRATPKPAERKFIPSEELMTVKLAYKQPDATKETESTYFDTAVTDSGKSWQQASEDYKFASSVSLFGMLLRNSPHIGQGNYALCKKLAEQGRGKDPKGYRTEFSDLVRKSSQ